MPGRGVVVLDNLSAGFVSALPSSAFLIIGDVCDYALVRSIIADYDVDTIMHFGILRLFPTLWQILWNIIEITP